MKIAFVYCPIPLDSRRNGIVSQCMTWAEGLREKGHSVILITTWDSYEWNTFDIIHVFGSTGIWFFGFINEVLKVNRHIAWSPICDNIDSPRLQYMKSLLGCRELGLFSLPYVRRLTYKLPIKVFVRSNYECSYIMRAYAVEPNKIEIVPLAMSHSNPIDVSPKEAFCFHLSALYHQRKNVIRLVKAANKYNFRLILAGTMGTEEEFHSIKEAISDNPNIKVLGPISEQQKEFLYKRAKVFALPSISEGVGIVALDAAHYGCDVVVTEKGGPKEYYANYAERVDPYDVDDIGRKIVKMLNSTHQPKLKAHVDSLYTSDTIIARLETAYRKL